MLTQRMFLMLLLLICSGVSAQAQREPEISPLHPKNRLAKALEELRTAEDQWRLSPLRQAAMASIDLEQLEQAQKYTDDLEETANRVEFGHNADVVHWLNILRGRLALRQDKLEEARKYLLKAGEVKGSPVLGSFGPNMKLAKELLEKNEREVVLQYFALCAKFWMHEDDTLKQWTQEVSEGKMPNFGGNLYY
ncbi:MAG: hypothetical protein JO360_08095 [Acidobacteria bacterium]|nr:hypothetical protein [Acidobacteriota bacterium]